MKIKISHGNLCFNFVVEAEGENEVQLLKQFLKHANKDYRFWLHSYGGNIEHTRESFCFGWRNESDFKPKGFWAKLKYLFS